MVDVDELTANINALVEHDPQLAAAFAETVLIAFAEHHGPDAARAIARRAVGPLRGDGVTKGILGTLTEGMTWPADEPGAPPAWACSVCNVAVDEPTIAAAATRAMTHMYHPLHRDALMALDRATADRIHADNAEG